MGVTVFCNEKIGCRVVTFGIKNVILGEIIEEELWDQYAFMFEECFHLLELVEITLDLYHTPTSFFIFFSPSHYFLTLSNLLMFFTHPYLIPDPIWLSLLLSSNFVISQSIFSFGFLILTSS